MYELRYIGSFITELFFYIANEGRHARMKNKKYHIIVKVPKFNRKFVEKGKMDTTNTQTRESSLSSIGVCTSIKHGGIKLVLFNGKIKKE